MYKQKTSWNGKVTFADAATQHTIKITSSLLPFLSSKRGESREIVFPHWFLESETSRLPRLYDAPPTAAPGCRVTSHISSSIRRRFRGSTQKLRGPHETGKQSVPAAAAVACNNGGSSSKQKRKLIRTKAFHLSYPRKKLSGGSKLMHLRKLLPKSEVLVSSLTAITSSTYCVVPGLRLQGALRVNRLHLKTLLLNSFQYKTLLNLPENDDAKRHSWCYQSIFVFLFAAQTIFK